jgi:hypothetical protein
MLQFPPDFTDFLRLLSEHRVDYLLIGGYAVGYHGYPRATGDMDIWIPVSPHVAEQMVAVFSDFGLQEGIDRDLFLRGVPPNRLKVTTHIDGVTFADCYPRRVTADFQGVQVTLIGLRDLRANKLAAGRLKDLADLENLPPG